MKSGRGRSKTTTTVTKLKEHVKFQNYFIKDKFKTERNRQVLNLRAQGYSYNEIAQFVHPRISPQRVREIIIKYKDLYE